MLALPLLVAALLPAQEKVDLAAMHRIRTEAFNHSGVMDHAFYMSEVYGPRLTGSPGLKAAGEWAARQFTQWGLANTAMEKWGPFGRGWTSTKFNASLKEPQYAPLIGFARPWSPGTSGPVAGQPVLATIATEADFDKYRGKLKGKIVLLGAPRQLALQTSAPAKVLSDADLASESLALARSISGDYVGSAVAPPGPAGGVRPPSRAAQERFRHKLNDYLTKEGAALAIIAGDRTDGGTVRATAAGSRDPKDPLPVPSVALTPEHYNRIARLIEKKLPVTLEFDIENKFLDDNKDSFNVVAELPGTDKKDEVVMLGAHMDSWTGGTGATDNAAGSSVVMEAMRILKATGLKPRRTVRAALWTGEEQGLLGSKAYIKAHFADVEMMALKPEQKKLAAYFNMDNGAGRIRGVYLQGNDMVRPIFEAWLAPFKDLGATALSIRNTTGTDH
ncbi:MAG: M20/M25/M40 family metallo-hydrolase, partial [Bryobacteraceae bacterium]